MGTNIFYPVTFTLEFNLFFYISHEYWQDLSEYTNIFDPMILAIYLFI